MFKAFFSIVLSNLHFLCTQYYVQFDSQVARNVCDPEMFGSLQKLG